MTAVATSGQSRGVETYTFSSQPRSTAAGSQTKKISAVLSDPNLKQQSYGNIMYDRRVIRGNTYALHTLPAAAQPDVIEIQKQEELRRRTAARRRAREQGRSASPDAVSGRKHMDVQTELYLEELTDRVEDADNFTQTDAFLDRPPTPLFVPAKTGRDASTQIEEGELFDFELESKPIIEVLVGKTVEQALLEVLEEEELSALREQQRQFEQKRHAELVETQRLEEQDRRRTHEKEKRMQQQREALLKERETAKKIAARAFAKSYLTDLVPSVFDALTAHGYFYDHVEREIVEDFIPWLMGEVKEDLTNSIDARRLLDNIIMDALGYKDTVEVTSQTVQEPSEATHEEPAVLATEEVPVEDKGEDKPVVVEGEDKPAVVEGEEKPAVIEGEDKPAVIEGEDKPAVVIEGEDKPVVVEGEDKPAVVEGEEKPVVIEGEDKPVVVEGEDKPAVVIEESAIEDKPAVTEGEDKPAVPAVVEGEDKSAVVEGEDKPAVVEGEDTQQPPTIAVKEPTIDGSTPEVTNGDQDPVGGEVEPVPEGDTPPSAEGVN